MTLKKNARLEKVEILTETTFKNPHRYRAKTIPVAGSLLRQEDVGEAAVAGWQRREKLMAGYHCVDGVVRVDIHNMVRTGCKKIS